MAFDIAQTLDPCLPGICRAAAFTCHKVNLNHKALLQRTVVTQTLIMLHNIEAQ
jgi:hypothetical protein